MKRLLSILMFVMLFCISDVVFGQQSISTVDSTKLYKLELNDGSVFFGKIIHIDSIHIVMRTASILKLEIPVSKIIRIEVIDKSNFKNNKYFFPNPHATRYIFSPSAYNLKKGEAYYQNTLLFINSFNVGISDHISFGGGIELISTLGSLMFGSVDPIFFITPKVGFKLTENFHAGGGILYISTPSFGSGNRSNLGITYAVGTLGSVEQNITGGLGWGFIDGEFSQRPIITISGMKRINKNTALVTENWFIPTNSYYGIYSYGIRFFGEKQSVDLSFINNADIAQSLFLGFPNLSFILKF